MHRTQVQFLPYTEWFEMTSNSSSRHIEQLTIASTSASVDGKLLTSAGTYILTYTHLPTHTHITHTYTTHNTTYMHI